MANVPTVVVGTGNQKKVVTPALLTGLDPNGLIVALQVDASGNLLTTGSNFQKIASYVGNGVCTIGDDLEGAKAFTSPPTEQGGRNSVFLDMSTPFQFGGLQMNVTSAGYGAFAVDLTNGLPQGVDTLIISAGGTATLELYCSASKALPVLTSIVFTITPGDTGDDWPACVFYGQPNMPNLSYIEVHAPDTLPVAGAVDAFINAIYATTTANITPNGYACTMDLSGWNDYADTASLTARNALIARGWNIIANIN